MKEDQITAGAVSPARGYVESFSVRPRDGTLNGEIIFSIGQAEIHIGSWRRRYNTIRPHASLSCIPDPEAFVPVLAAWPDAIVSLARSAKAIRGANTHHELISTPHQPMEPVNRLS